MSQYRPYPAPCVIALLAATALGVLTSAAIADQTAPPAIPAQEQPEVLSSGPVHEAFAEPVNLQLQAGVTAPEQPPPNIEEVPPEERPQGQQFVWIPGYWAWDADRHSYIWVSACWRVAPPRMSWVPGYWSPVSGGWEWVAGFWTPAGVREIEYLPAPPTAGDVEPYGTAPSPDTIWVPPCMYWVRDQYVRRSGYWLAAQQNWVWVPSHYVSTPRGYIFADGHWDYSMEQRGVLFAPIFFPASVYGRMGLSYSPSIVIDLGLLRGSLFAYPRYSHYYFGDYYDDAYLSIGIYPWFDCRRLHTWYDPVYEHDRWRNQRSEPRWEARERDDYNRRRADKDLRPARTFRDQESRLAKMPEPQRRAYQVAQPITLAANSRANPLKFERINTDARQKISKQATAVRTYRDERTRWESTPANPKTASQSSGERRTAVPLPAVRQETVLPPKEHKATVTPPIVQPPGRGEREGAVMAPAARQETVLPPKEHKATVTPPTVQPPGRGEREGAVMAPATHKVEPTPAPQRVPAFVPNRETRVSQPERVQIPVSPVVGKSGASGIFQKGPPSRPDDEGRDKEGNSRRR